MTTDNIKRYVPTSSHGGMIEVFGDGGYVTYSDHIAARAADNAEIDRLTNICKLWEQRYESTISVAEARIAELEAYKQAVMEYRNVTQAHVPGMITASEWIEMRVAQLTPNPQGERA